MIFGIILDVVVLVLLGLGYLKGYKRGVVTMSVTLISFIVGIIGLKTIGTLMYSIFGESLENLIRDGLIKTIADTDIITVILRQMVDEALVKKLVQMVVFVIVFIIASIITAYIFKKTKLSRNSAFINALDKNFGGVVGVLSHVVTVMLIFGIISILGGNDISESSIAPIGVALESSYVSKFLYAINPIRLLLG